MVIIKKFEYNQVASTLNNTSLYLAFTEGYERADERCGSRGLEFHQSRLPATPASTSGNESNGSYSQELQIQQSGAITRRHWKVVSHSYLK